VYNRRTGMQFWRKAMKEIVDIPDIRKPVYSYSNIVREGNILYLTSQLSCNLKTGETIPGSIEEQTKNALENISVLLGKADSSLDNVLRARVYMRDVSEFKRMDKVYRTYFKAGNEPARVTVQAPSPLEDIKIEIEVTAVVNGT
jgi:2-iminobutanoate/2-iminopropanoate deaminase